VSGEITGRDSEKEYEDMKKAATVQWAGKATKKKIN